VPVGTVIPEHLISQHRRITVRIIRKRRRGASGAEVAASDR
jgi:hypothetical protein